LLTGSQEFGAEAMIATATIVWSPNGYPTAPLCVENVTRSMLTVEADAIADVRRFRLLAVSTKLLKYNRHWLVRLHAATAGAEAGGTVVVEGAGVTAAEEDGADVFCALRVGVNTRRMITRSKRSNGIR
jgi:hypothetical protein